MRLLLVFVVMAVVLGATRVMVAVTRLAVNDEPYVRCTGACIEVRCDGGRDVEVRCP